MKRFILLLLALIVVACIAASCGDGKSAEDKRVEKELIEMADKYNSEAPFMVNETTQLDSISVLPNRTLQYNLTMVNLLKEETDIEYFEEQKLIVTGQLRESLPEKAHQDKVIFIYSYCDKNANFAYKITITPDMYSK